MKFKIKSAALSTLTLGLGGIGLALRALLYATGEDAKGLLAPWHICTILVWLLTAAVAVLLAVFLRGQDGSNRYRSNFPPSKAGAAGAFAAGLGVAYTILSELDSVWDTLSTLWMILGILSAVSLILTGVCRLNGKRPQFIFHVLLCCFLALNLAIQYRMSSNNPQLQDYVFQILACVCLMLTAYHHAAFDVGMGRRRGLIFFSLMSAYLCCLCLYGGCHKILFLTCGAWSLLNACSLTPVPRRPKPAPAEGAPDEGA